MFSSSLKYLRGSKFSNFISTGQLSARSIYVRRCVPSITVENAYDFYYNLKNKHNRRSPSKQFKVGAEFNVHEKLAFKNAVRTGHLHLDSNCTQSLLNHYYIHCLVRHIPFIASKYDYRELVVIPETIKGFNNSEKYARVMNVFVKEAQQYLAEVPTKHPIQLSSVESLTDQNNNIINTPTVGGNDLRNLFNSIDDGISQGMKTFLIYPSWKADAMMIVEGLATIQDRIISRAPIHVRIAAIREKRMERLMQTRSDLMDTLEKVVSSNAEMKKIRLKYGTLEGFRRYIVDRDIETKRSIARAIHDRKNGLNVATPSNSDTVESKLQ